MLYKNFFPKGASRQEIVKSIKAEGFNPILITDEPGFVYETHTHPETKLIVCLEGSMRVKVEKEEYDFAPGDKILIPGKIPHGGVVGKDGCVYYWSEKIVIDKNFTNSSSKGSKLSSPRKAG